MFKFIELCIFLCRLVLFVSALAKWLAGKLVISFVSKGFPYKDQIEKLFIVMVYSLLCVFPTRDIVNLLIAFTFLTATYLSKEWCSLFVLKVLLNPNQSVNQSPLSGLTYNFVFRRWLAHACGGGVAQKGSSLHDSYQGILIPILIVGVVTFLEFLR